MEFVQNYIRSLVILLSALSTPLFADVQLSDTPESASFINAKNNNLYQIAMVFRTHIKTLGSITKIKDDIYDEAQHLNFVSTLTFINNVLNRLPKYRDLFETVGEKHGLDWRLLAATAYQESLWNPKAVSPTGVRGLMMLTKITAKELEIVDRLNPQQSVAGGALYLSRLVNRLPKRITSPNRLWMALASYNIGSGHLEDARILTQRFGANPDRWQDVKKHLPLLARSEWHRQTKHGHARGKEAVQYVRNIRSYYEILVWLTSKQAKIMLVENEASDLLLSAL
ncbi:MAG: transglycosylase SLT domain-containing protein [Gammaproteobacteria bacterium]|nr:transglycosylase SLT domain-containing protein [Gammaproteobacteria bacterium]